ncbi:glycoside hydrolase family 104 protein [Desulfovibrio sp. OttesenSCG-928-G15]|nr:glycoside hydrolase family 104 protein [Desulfovibrio sp. OttesenSCG-928-G15]
MSIPIRSINPQGFRGTGGTRATPNSFGAQIADAGMGLANTVGDVGGRLGVAIDRVRLERESTNMVAKITGLQDDYRAFDTEYRSKNKGQSALNATQDYDEFLGQRIEEYRAGITDQRVLNDFDNKVSSFRQSVLNGAASYQMQEEKNWKVDTLDAARTDMLKIAADPNAPDEIRQMALDSYAREEEALYPGVKEMRQRETEELFRKASKERFDQQFSTHMQADDIDGAKQIVSAASGKTNIPKINSDNIKAAVETYADHPNVRAFLNVIAKAEGTHGRGDNGYNISFGGSTFQGYGRHPNVSRQFKQTDGKTNSTTAAGRYQFLKGTYDEAGKVMGLDDFSPRSQDKAAVYLIAKRGALEDVVSGNAEAALKKLGKEWASLPSSPYAQKTRSTKEVMGWLGSFGYGMQLKPTEEAGYKKAIEVAEHRAEAAKEKQQKEARQQIVDSSFASMQKLIDPMPLDDQRVVGEAMIAQVEDEDAREQLGKKLNSDLSRKKTLQNANDMSLMRQYREFSKENGWTHAQAAAGVDKVQGLSEEGKEKLHASLTKDGQKTTPQNHTAYNDLRRAIDSEVIADDTAIDSFAFERGLTDAQVKGAKKYLEEGGNTAKVSISRVEGLFKRMGKGAKPPESLYDDVINNLEPGKPITEEHLRKAISRAYMTGETPDGSIYWGYGKDESYSEAVKRGRGRDWLPDVTEEEQHEYGAALRARGEKVTDVKLRQYKKYEIMKIPAEK